ncbi:hypothetical protein DFH08DRAFT_860389 [Mycena albidolilacea]|uniref:Uncharacterized protein n=1 Tax=Mycena albidolilacea TaxID=1033008 RepID=A0AAD7A8K2_9AGAR|nr:hypothetical protein DFH08DRAFT_860388 [Mycena albidolilacea]KAJ7351391.1 hypothetical protein DFH08DRAFT_860389 [Mycena albidolilacea]
MQFNTVKLAVLLAASGFSVAAPGPAAAEAATSGDLNARVFDFGSFCTGPGAVGCNRFQRPSLPSGCVNNSPEWINNISFYTIDAGFKCTWFNFANCGGDSITTTGSASVNLAGTNFDNNLESYKCDFA